LATINLQAEFLELPQRLRVSCRVVHRVVRVRRHTVFLPLRRFRGVLDQARVDVSNAPSRNPNGFRSRKRWK